MFFTQPALPGMHTEKIVRNCDGKASRLSRKVDEVKGVRMGQLSDIWPDYGPTERYDTIRVAVLDGASPFITPMDMYAM